MDREPVSSSNLVSVGYDEEDQILEIEFQGGRVYQYFNVPQRIFDELISADSIGSYHHENIRDRFQYTEI